MRVAGHRAFEYDGPGSGCVFPSEAHHRSGDAAPGTLKITFFFGLGVPAASLYLARSLRGELRGDGERGGDAW